MPAHEPGDPVARILGRLDDVRGGDGRWTARCPAPRCAYRLSVGVGRDGRALLHCPAGCEVAKITAALGLSVRDLFPRSRRGGGGRP